MKSLDNRRVILSYYEAFKNIVGISIVHSSRLFVQVWFMTGILRCKWVCYGRLNALQCACLTMSMNLTPSVVQDWMAISQGC